MRRGDFALLRLQTLNPSDATMVWSYKPSGTLATTLHAHTNKGGRGPPSQIQADLSFDAFANAVTR